MLAVWRTAHRAANSAKTQHGERRRVIGESERDQEGQSDGGQAAISAEDRRSSLRQDRSAGPGKAR